MPTTIARAAAIAATAIAITTQAQIVHTVLIAEGDPVPGAPTETIAGPFGKPSVSADGRYFAFAALNTENFGTDILIAGLPSNFTKVLEVGQILPTPLAYTIADIAFETDINIHGEVLFRVRDLNTNAVALVIYDIPSNTFTDTGIHTGAPVPGFPSQAIGTNIEDFAILDDGRIGAYFRGTTPGLTDLAEDFITLGNTVLLQGSTTVPVGTTNNIGRIAGFPFFTDAGQWATTGILDGLSSTRNDVIILNGAVAAIEFGQIPALEPTRFIDFQYNLANSFSLGRDGSWMFHGSFQDTANPRRFVALNGTAVALAGQPIADGSAENWSLTSPFSGVNAFTANKAVYQGRAGTGDNPLVLLENGTRTIFGRNGTPVDTTGDGIPDTDTITNLEIAKVTNAQATYWTVGRFGQAGTSGVAAIFTTVTACAADFDGDGLTTFNDITEFLLAADAISPLADLNGDQVIDFFDTLAFLAQYAQGC